MNSHDRIISEIAKVLDQKKFDIYTNPGQEKNAGIGDNFPDVIVVEKGTKTVRFILEIETEKSITLNEANSQWKKYSNEINATFYLVVPKNLLIKATQISQQVGINVRFATYSIDGNNVVKFKFK